MRALRHSANNSRIRSSRGVYALSQGDDVLKNPQLSRGEKSKILATPTLAKDLPPPVRRIIGEFFGSRTGTDLAP